MYAARGYLKRLCRHRDHVKPASSWPKLPLRDRRATGTGRAHCNDAGAVGPAINEYNFNKSTYEPLPGFGANWRRHRELDERQCELHDSPRPRWNPRLTVSAARRAFSAYHLQGFEQSSRRSTVHHRPNYEWAPSSLPERRPAQESFISIDPHVAASSSMSADLLNPTQTGHRRSFSFAIIPIADSTDGRPLYRLDRPATRTLRMGSTSQRDGALSPDVWGSAIPNPPGTPATDCGPQAIISIQWQQRAAVQNGKIHFIKIEQAAMTEPEAEVTRASRAYEQLVTNPGEAITEGWE